MKVVILILVTAALFCAEAWGVGISPTEFWGT